MDALVFPSDEALQVALTSGLVPAEVQRGQASVGRTKDGEVLVAPAVNVPSKAKKALVAAGVRERAVPSLSKTVSCWPEALPPKRIGEPTTNPKVVLFTVEGRGTLLDLAGELLRLGCDRQELRALDGSDGLTALVRVVEPPWFVLSRALDHLDGLRAFVPTPGGRDRVFCEVAWQHPLEAQLEPDEDDGLVLVTAEGAWWRVPEGKWTDVDHLIETSSSVPSKRRSADAGLPRIPVTLSLSRATRAEAPTFFVLRPAEHSKSPKAQVEALVRGLPEAQLENVLFAASGDMVVLRARPGREANTGALPGTPYARLADLPNLFVPVGLTVEPPLRRDRLRTWLAPDPDLVTWLEPTDAGFSRVSLDESSFQPLEAWVEYVIDGAQDTLTPWVRSATFALEPFIAAEEAAPAETSRTRDDGEEKAQRARPKGRAEPRAAPVAAPAEPQRAAPVVAVEVARTPSEVEALVAREEAAFLEMEARSDTTERQQAWARLGELYARVQRPRDAGMAWAHSVWEAPETAASALSRRWADTSGGRLDALLAEKTPNVEQTRAAAAHLVASALEGATVSRLADWSAFFDKFDDDLDVRSFWLARFALSRLAGGDALGLARARDRVLGRLQRGLSLDRDVPRLMRVTGTSSAGGAGTERALRVSNQLEALLKAFDETPRKRSPVEAPQNLTRAYVGFEFAWGFARLGAAERARSLREQSLAVLEKVSSSKDPKDQNPPVHRYLMRAFSARIDQALEGVSPETPLGADINGQLPTLEPFQRYKVDRLRQFSAVLEPQERLDATSDFFRAHQSHGAEELAALRGMKDPAELLKGIVERAAVAADGQLPVEERARLVDGLLDFLPSVPESQALPLLQRFVGLADGMPARLRALLYEDALKVAGHFGRTALVKQLVASLGRLFSELGSEGLSELGATLVAGVRSLRRVGLRDEAAELLQRASVVLKGDDTKTQIARLGLAGGLAYLGQTTAQPIIDDALARLARGESGLVPLERLKLTRFTARALGHLPTEIALPGLLRLAQQLPWVTDAFNTNSHFCLSVVDFADALVLGHVGDDLTLNEATRRFLEEDEYLVRRRVHRDVGAAT